ncbi:MAG: hypothetical protein U1F51_14490 [Burkholderiales bacterium]
MSPTAALCRTIPGIASAQFFELGVAAAVRLERVNRAEPPPVGRRDRLAHGRADVGAAAVGEDLVVAQAERRIRLEHGEVLVLALVTGVPRSDRRS